MAATKKLDFPTFSWEIMIFDEATSSLDTKSENYIHQSISKLKGSRIIIIIQSKLCNVLKSICAEGAYCETARIEVQPKVLLKGIGPS